MTDVLLGKPVFCLFEGEPESKGEDVKEHERQYNVFQRFLAIFVKL